MKRIHPIFLAVALLFPLAPLPAQDADSAARIAERQDAEERYKRLNAAVEDLLTAQVALQKRIEALAQENRALREESARAASELVSRDELRALAVKVQELDKLRQEDKKLILGELQKLLKTPPTQTAKAKPKLEPATGPLDGYEYVVQQGDGSLVAIVNAYRKQGVKVTVEDVQKANPGLNPNRMQIGQKIFIPDPGQ
jgi:LysM repeat protein